MGRRIQKPVGNVGSLMERIRRPTLLQRPVSVKARSVIPVTLKCLDHHVIAQIAFAARGPVANVRNAQPNPSLAGMNGLDELDGAGIILAGDVKARPLIEVGEKLGKCEARIMMGVKILRPELPGMGAVRLKVPWAWSLHKTAGRQRLKESLRPRRSPQMIGCNDKWELNVGNGDSRMIADRDGPVTQRIVFRHANRHRGREVKAGKAGKTRGQRGCRRLDVHLLGLGRADLPELALL